MSSVQPRWKAGYSVCVPRELGSSEPSAWIRRKSAAWARLAIRARAMLPMLVPVGARPRHHDADAGALEERAEAQRDPQVQLGLA